MRLPIANRSSCCRPRLGHHYGRAERPVQQRSEDEGRSCGRALSTTAPAAGAWQAIGFSSSSRKLRGMARDRAEGWDAKRENLAGKLADG